MQTWVDGLGKAPLGTLINENVQPQRKRSLGDWPQQKKGEYAPVEKPMHSQVDNQMIQTCHLCLQGWNDQTTQGTWTSTNRASSRKLHQESEMIMLNYSIGSMDENQSRWRDSHKNPDDI